MRGYEREKSSDGYINATELCKASNKQFKHYNENKTTQEFLTELSSEVGIPTSELVHIIKGGDYRFQGTYVHPQVKFRFYLIHLACCFSLFLS